VAELPGNLSVVLPHTGVARLLTGVTSCQNGAVRATAAIPASHPLCDGRHAPIYLGLELGAQAAAAMEAIERARGKPSSGAVRGSLVRVREATLLAPHLPVDVPLQVTARLEGAAPPVAIYRIDVAVDGHTVMHAIISTHNGTTAGSGS